MTTDLALVDDIYAAVAALIRRVLKEQGELEDLRRFRAETADASWRVRLVDDTYVVSWSDGTKLYAIDADAVAAAVGLIRAHRASPALQN